MTDTALEERDEAIAEALVAGRSVRSVRKEFNLTLDEIDAIIARTWPVDNRARVRMIMTDLGLLAEGPASLHSGRALRVPTVPRLGLREPTHVPAWAKPCAPAAREARCSA